MKNEKKYQATTTAVDIDTGEIIKDLKNYRKLKTEKSYKHDHKKTTTEYITYWRRNKYRQRTIFDEGNRN